MKKRYYPKRDKKLPKGYDSWLEYDLHQTTLKKYNHHPDKVDYYIWHTYEPDFVHPKYPNILIECKGRMRDNTESSKYKWIRDCNKDIEIIFILEKPDLAMPFAKKRKDGTKLSHKEWCEKEGFRWFTKETFPGVEAL